MNFRTKLNVKHCEQKKHVKETPRGYMLINNPVYDSAPPMHHSDNVIFIGNVCPNPFKLSKLKTFVKHSKRIPNERNN